MYQTIILAFLLSISMNLSWAASEERMYDTIEQMVHSSHTSLKSAKFSFYKLTHPSYFFVSNFGLGRVLLGHDHYHIGFNPSVFENNIDQSALEGVLAHELIHSEDYISGSTLGTLLPIGLKVLGSSSRIQYERKTDLRTILKGYGEQLISYKEFQYPLLSQDDLRTKKEEYLTPEEVRFVMKLPASAVRRWIDNDAPLDIEDMQLSEWINTNYPYGFSKNNRLQKGKKYKLNIKTPTLKSGYKISPVSCEGDILFSKSFTTDKEKVTYLSTSNNVCGLVISNKNFKALHLFSR